MLFVEFPSKLEQGRWLCESLKDSPWASSLKCLFSPLSVALSYPGHLVLSPCIFSFGHSSILDTCSAALIMNTRLFYSFPNSLTLSLFPRSYTFVCSPQKQTQGWWSLFPMGIL